MNSYDAHFTFGEFSVFGVNAEVLSVLEDSSFWGAIGGTRDRTAAFIEALDTRTPPEERVSKATHLIDSIRSTRALARWVPRYSSLAKHEFAQEFYPAYRDHSIHSLQVFLLGLYLYETVEPIRRHLDNRLTNVAPDPRFDAKTLFLEWWTLTALWHDIGYPFEATTFLLSSETRKHMLKSISEALDENIFRSGFTSQHLRFSEYQMRKIYQAGRFYPVRLDSPDTLLTEGRATSLIHKMWVRLGVGLDFECVTRELDRITTTGPIGRAPYHDHGIWGALLLGLMTTETESFLSNLAESKEAQGKDLDPLLGQVVMDAWEAFGTLDGVIRLAIEAVAFHNVSLQQLDPIEVARLCGGETPSTVSLATEPHLFFIGLSDTLQDWDRHHFVPQDGKTYRPAVRASDMLLQGQGQQIKVSLRKEERPAVTVRRLFSNWLTSADVNSLIGEGAAFSRPDRVLSGSTVSLAADTVSRKERRRLESRITTAVAESQSIMLKGIRGDDSALIHAAGCINDILRQIEESKSILTKTDTESVREFLISSGLRQAEAQAFALMRVGSRLPLGQVESQIGAGGFGTVYRVVSDEGGGRVRELAFKLFQGTDLGIEEKRRLFARGYNAMLKLNGHPNVVKVFQFSEMPLGFYMQFVPGQDLERGLKSLTLMSERLDIARKIAETLAFAHSKGVKHRDVKPSNVLLDATNDLEPVLTDFDLAWIDGRTTNTKVAYATYAYGAPEQFNERLAKWRTLETVDIYGFGALLYFLVTNQNPPSGAIWTSGHWHEVQSRLEGHLPAVAVSKLVDLLQDATRVDPDKRIQSMNDVVRRLSGCIALTLSSGGILDADAWLAEVRYRLNGIASTDVYSPMLSRTGGVTWTFGSSRETPSTLDLLAQCALNRDPTYEGVNFDGFRTSCTRQMESQIRQFKDTWRSIGVTRHGQLGASGSSIKIEIRSTPKTLEIADAVGQLLASLTRIAEQ